MRIDPNATYAQKVNCDRMLEIPLGNDRFAELYWTEGKMTSEDFDFAWGIIKQVLQRVVAQRELAEWCYEI